MMIPILHNSVHVLMSFLGGQAMKGGKKEKWRKKNNAWLGFSVPIIPDLVFSCRYHFYKAFSFNRSYLLKDYDKLIRFSFNKLGLLFINILNN